MYSSGRGGKVSDESIWTRDQEDLCTRTAIFRYSIYTHRLFTLDPVYILSKHSIYPEPRSLSRCTFSSDALTTLPTREREISTAWVARSPGLCSGRDASGNVLYLLLNEDHEIHPSPEDGDAQCLIYSQSLALHQAR